MREGSYSPLVVARVCATIRPLAGYTADVTHVNPDRLRGDFKRHSNALVTRAQGILLHNAPLTRRKHFR